MATLHRAMDDLVNYVKESRQNHKQEAEERKANLEAAANASDQSKVGDGQEERALDITDDMVNLFVRFDVQRRFFNIVSMEILAQQFGLKEPPSLT